MKKQEFELLIKEEQKIDVIKELSDNDELPLILWGAGQVAEKVKKYIEKFGIIITAVWVDGVIKNSTFDMIPVLSLQEIKERYSKFNVILGHSKYNLGEELAKRERQINKIYYLTSVAYGQYDNFDYKFIKENINKYYETCELLDDDLSQKAMIAYLNSRINNNINYIKEYAAQEQTYFNNDIYHINDKEIYLDIGAFNGDSIRLFLDSCRGKYNKIYAFEAENKNFMELKSYVKNSHIKNIYLYNIGVWKEKGFLNFQKDGQESGVSLLKEDNEICVDALDNILSKEPITLIKINFSLGLLEALIGAKNILQKNKPKLAIVIGYDEWLLITIPQYIKHLVPEYRVYLRYNRCMPACLTLYAVAE